ncbi:MAG: hypothetical protein LQ351_007587 [Letrouitia transgressa]|nr:MAG: hypothetical protein LQ351_007587 [Letrouitia transgressa]
MDAPDLAPLLDTLEDTIDDLEDALAPLLAATGDQTLATLAAKAPLLDKAQLYVAVTYTVESLLFSYLRLHGVDAKAHAVWGELERVRGYFKKIKGVQEEGKGKEERTLRVDKGAAGRVVRHVVGANRSSDVRTQPQPQQQQPGVKRINPHQHGAAR